MQHNYMLAIETENETLTAARVMEALLAIREEFHKPNGNGRIIVISIKIEPAVEAKRANC